MSSSSGADAGQLGSAPQFSSPTVPRQTACASDQPPVPKVPPPGASVSGSVPQAPAVPLRGPDEPLDAAVEPEESSSLPSAAATAVGTANIPPSRPAEAPFVFIREVRPYFLDKPRIKLQRRVGALLFSSANWYGDVERDGDTGGEGFERRKVVVELVHCRPSGGRGEGRIKRWKAYAVCTRGFHNDPDAQKRRPAPTAYALSNHGAVDELRTQGATVLQVSLSSHLRARSLVRSVLLSLSLCACLLHFCRRTGSSSCWRYQRVRSQSCR